MADANPPTETTPTVVPVPSKPKAKMLSEGNFRLAQYVTNRWSVTLDDATPYDRLFDTDYWSHVARKLQIGDIVEVHAENGTWFAELYVVSAHRLAAKVVELRKVGLATAPESETVASPFSVKWRGPNGKWAIMRGNDVMQSGFASMEEAEIAKANLAKTLAA